RRFVDWSIERFGLNQNSRVIEIGSNDGYLLQFFVARHIHCLGIDPAANCAAVAQREYGVETIVAFFGRETAADLVQQGLTADLVIANNVLAHVPDLHDFVAGVSLLLERGGTASFEFPHLLELIIHNQFDTIYHEHYSYFSLLALQPILHRHGLTLADIERVPTHGGSLRLFVTRAPLKPTVASPVAAIMTEERAAGLDRLDTYVRFSEQVKSTKRQLLELLIRLKENGKTIAAYGAPAKGNTLLNYCGIRTDFIDFTVDKNPRKQGTFLPGTLIPVREP